MYTLPMDISIRKASLADASRLSDLLRRIDLFPAVRAEQPAETLQRLQRHLALCLGDDSHSVYIAEGQAGNLLAYAAVHWLPYLIQKGPEGFISELFVDVDARGQGVGTCLLTVVEAEARQRGCARLSLINMRNRESYQRGFYMKLGWQERPNAANFTYLL
jgi:GNAT superfamily N-acetyltransferase